MSDIKLFHTSNGTVEELKGTSIQLEKSLQTLIEQHLEAFLAIRFVASEHSTGDVHRGRIDTLGIDEHNSPVIVEYKRSVNENVINQGLYYLNWLMDHKAEYELLVIGRLGTEQSAKIQWGAPRLLCIASDFTKFDEQAIQQMNRNIELIRYRRYADDFLLLELLNATTTTPIKLKPPKQPLNQSDDYLEKRMKQASAGLRDCFEALKRFFLELGDDVGMRVLQDYVAFTRIRTLAYVHIVSKGNVIHVDIKAGTKVVPLVPGLTEVGTNGWMRVILKTTDDVENAKPTLLAVCNTN
jgi:predicted transport protein